MFIQNTGEYIFKDNSTSETTGVILPMKILGDGHFEFYLEGIQPQKKLKGFLKGLKITEEEIEGVKKTLFKTNF